MAFLPPRAPARFSAPGVLLLASLALFGEGLLPGRAFFFRDVLHYYWPMQATHWRLGVVPQWNPFHQGGLPFLADIHAGVLYPPNVLFAILSFPTAYALLLVLHHFVGQLGLYTFLRGKGFERPAALTGALAFGLSGYVAGLCNAGPLMLGLAWMPWVLVTLQSGLVPLRKLAVLAVLIALQLISGDPQSALYSAIASAAHVAWFSERRPQLVALSGAGALGLLLAGVQVFPTLWLLAESTRGTDAPTYLASWNLPPPRLLEFAFPYPFGEYLGQPQFWAWGMLRGPSTVPFALSVYLGITVLVLAVLGVRRERFSGFALTLCAVGVLLALGQKSPLSFLLAAPPLSFFRYPEKYVVLVALGCAGLAASGARAVLAGVSRRWLAGLGAGALLLGALLGFTWAWPSTAVTWATGLLGLATGDGSHHGVIAGLAARSLGTSLCFMAGMLALAALASRHPAHRALPAALLLLVAGDLLWTARVTVFVGPTSLYREPEIVGRLREEVGSPPTRLFRQDKPLKANAPPSRSLEGLIHLRHYELATLKSNLAGVFGLEEVTSYGAVELWRYRAFMDVLAARPELVGRLYGACLWTTSSAPGSTPGAELVSILQGPDRLDVKRLSGCPPRLRTASRTTAVPDQSEALRALSTGSVDGLENVAVEGGTSRSYAPARVDAVELGARNARARVVAGAGGTFLVFATTSYPGWTATVDGEEAPVLTVDGALMGIEVPEGTHQVDFEFTDPGLSSGIQASLAAALVLALLLVLSRRSTGAAAQTEASPRPLES
ncbi:YfhO family protein [Cystobacter fuscus]|uniref:YfhO family protein n=1 Tax=Cystobacter fuscus TaxID=43 RepID=UPI002B2C6DC7|nr:YfhO family protein [Cystobacter fuscus]